jgi:hypothetical protein
MGSWLRHQREVRTMEAALEERSARSSRAALAELLFRYGLPMLHCKPGTKAGRAEEHTAWDACCYRLRKAEFVSHEDPTRPR